MTPVVLTIGHSTRTLDVFVHLLQAHGVTRLVDVRTMPRSRQNPQFNQETLPGALQAEHISYQHIPGLGGLRHTRRDSPNTAWRNVSFRGYADYMQTPEFKENLQRVIDMAQNERVALMCAEAVPWRCHRSLIADALLVRGMRVEHIMSEAKCLSHSLRPWARVKGTRITYPLEPGAELDQALPNLRAKSAHESRTTFQEVASMTHDFKVGDHVEWNSEAGQVRGTIKKKIITEITFKGYTVHASKEEPQYMIESDKTDHQAMHKGSALKKIAKRTASSKKGGRAKVSQSKAKS